MASILLLAILTPSVFASSYSKMFDIVYRNDLFYSSYLFLKKSIERNEKVSPKKVGTVLDLIHPSVFIHDYDLDRFTNKKSPIDYAVAVRRFFLNDFRTAKKKLITVKPDNSMYIESNYLLGLIYLTENNFPLADRYFKRCVRFADKKKRTQLKSEAYIATFKNRCIQQVSRLNFSQKKYKASLRILDYVQKTDYIWPRFLLDKGWAFYWTGENERALGSVMTYKAPLLRRFMVPEANYLRALIYYEMCYFGKTEKIIDEFNNNTWRYRKVAKTASKNRLIKLMASSRPPKSQNDQFLYFYLKGFKKDIRFFSFKKANSQITDEISRLARIKSLKQARIFLKTLYYYKKAVQEDFKDFLKNLTDDYYLQIERSRNAFVKLELTMNSQRRKYIASNRSTKFQDEIKDLDLDQISNTEEKFIWDFQGGFWADELGDYAVALDNRCRK